MKYIVLNFNEFTVEKMTDKQIIDRFAETVPTPAGVAPKYQYDEENEELIEWLYGKRIVVQKNVDPVNAHLTLLEWALMDAENEDSVVIVRDVDQAREIIDSTINDCLDPEDDVELIKKCEAMKKAL